MDPYLFSLALGGAGLGVMALSGLGHQVGHGHGGHSGGHGGHVGHGHAGHVGHAHGGHAGAHAGHGGAHSAAGHAVGGAHAGTHGTGSHLAQAAANVGARAFWTLTSPRVVFSFLVGLGVTGLIARVPLGEPFALIAAIAGGIAFERLLVTPMWNFLFRFASEPATTLESAVLDEARATSGFDAKGQGLVAIELDGQIVQLLGTLAGDDREAGIRVRAGDRLRVEEVDAARNRCTVKYLGREG